MNGGAQPFFILSLPIRRTVNLFHSLWQGLYKCAIFEETILVQTHLFVAADAGAAAAADLAAAAEGCR